MMTITRVSYVEHTVLFSEGLGIPMVTAFGRAWMGQRVRDTLPRRALKAGLKVQDYVLWKLKKSDLEDSEKRDI